MDTDDAADFRDFVETIVREQQENMTWDPVHWRTCLAVIAATLLPDKAISDYLSSQGAELSTKFLPSVVKRGNARLLRLTIGTLRKFGRWTPDDWHCGIALAEAWCSKDMYHVLVTNGVVFRPDWLVPAVRNKDTGTIIITIIHGLKYIGHWKPTGTEVQQALEESINHEHSVCFYCLLSEGAIAATRQILPAIRTGNQDMIRELVRNLKAWNRSTWMVDKHVIQALEEVCANGDSVVYSLLIDEGVEPSHSCLLSAMRLGDFDIGSRVLGDLKRRGRYRAKCESASYLGKINDILQSLPHEKRTSWLHLLRDSDVRLCSSLETTSMRYTERYNDTQWYTDVNQGDPSLSVSDTILKVKAPTMFETSTEDIDIVSKHTSPRITDSCIFEREGKVKSRDGTTPLMEPTLRDTTIRVETISRDTMTSQDEKRSKQSHQRDPSRSVFDTIRKVKAPTMFETSIEDIDRVGKHTSPRITDSCVFEREGKVKSRDDTTTLMEPTLRDTMTSQDEKRSKEKVTFRDEDIIRKMKPTEPTTHTPPNSPMAAAYELPTDDLVRLLSVEEGQFPRHDYSIDEYNDTTEVKLEESELEDTGLRSTLIDAYEQSTEVKHHDDCDENYNNTLIASNVRTYTDIDDNDERRENTTEEEDAMTKRTLEYIKPKLTIARPRSGDDVDTALYKCVVRQTTATDKEESYSTTRRRLQELFHPRVALPRVRLTYHLDDTYLWRDNQECKGAKTRDMFYLKRRFLYGLKSNIVREKYKDHLNAIHHM